MSLYAKASISVRALPKVLRCRQTDIPSLTEAISHQARTGIKKLRWMLKCGDASSLEANTILLFLEALHIENHQHTIAHNADFLREERTTSMNLLRPSFYRSLA